MKHLKTLQENQIPLNFSKNVDPDSLASSIDDLLGEYLEIEDVPYAKEDGLKHISYESRQRAAAAIVEFLKNEKII